MGRPAIDPVLKRLYPDRVLDAEWEIRTPRLFSVPVTILAQSARGALASVAAAISEGGANIESVDMQDAHHGEGYVQIHFRLQVGSAQHLNEVLNHILAQPLVERAVRG